MGATLYVVLHAFAVRSGRRHRCSSDLQRGAGLPRTGVEERADHARDHGHHARHHVPRPVDPRRARPRRSLRERHAHRDQPDRSARLRSGTFGNVLYYVLQAGTMLILVLAANTSFADFPGSPASTSSTTSCPASYHPRPPPRVLQRHRLPHGLIHRRVDRHRREVGRLIPLYAIGVFTSFTLSQAGMAKHHLRLREPRWHYGVCVNAVGAALSLLVLAIVAVVKFTHGAWFMILVVPVMVSALVRLNRRTKVRSKSSRRRVTGRVGAVLRRHAVIVLVDHLDAATARAIQYARTLTPDELRAVHFDLDHIMTEHLSSVWSDPRASPLPARHHRMSRSPHSARRCRAGCHRAGDDDTESTVLIPRRQYTQLWHRMLHDRTADDIAATLAAVPHCNVTIVPYHLGTHAPTTSTVESTTPRYDVSSGDQRRTARPSCRPSRTPESPRAPNHHADRRHPVPPTRTGRGPDSHDEGATARWCRKPGVHARRRHRRHHAALPRAPEHPRPHGRNPNHRGRNCRVRPGAPPRSSTRSSSSSPTRPPRADGLRSGLAQVRVGRSAASGACPRRRGSTRSCRRGTSSGGGAPSSRSCRWYATSRRTARRSARRRRRPR